MTRQTFLAAWLALSLLKLAIAAGLPLFGDEAFYAWESRHLAWSYSDLPPLTAWLIALGSALVPGELGVRGPFLLLGMLLPWQVIWLTRAGMHDEAVAWRAGVLALLLPLATAIGVLALPDVPLAVLSVAAAHALLIALQHNRHVNGAWLWLGAILALGMLCHYRFAVVPLVIALVTLAHPAGRVALRGPWPWLGAVVASLSLLPLLLFNAGHQFAGVRFQLIDRHPWTWQANGSWQLAEQALVVSPVLFVLFAVMAWRLLRRRPLPPPASVLLPLGLGVWLVFFVLGFFADNERFRWHWALPAYLILLPLLAVHWPAWSLSLRRLAWASALLVTALVFAYFAAGIWPAVGTAVFDGKRFPSHFSGWRDVAAWQSTVSSDETPLVVDNFMLAAALRFYMPDVAARLRVLDDPSNTHHGRAAQLAIWKVDERALHDQPAEPGWLLVEETARRFSDRWAWYQGLCARFANLRLEGVLDLYDGRKRFVRWRHDGYAPSTSCSQVDAMPPLGWVDERGLRWRRGEPLVLEGWVVQAGQGIESVELRIDGESAARVPRSQAAGWPSQLWGDAVDPAGEQVGFRLEQPASNWSATAQTIQVLAHRPDGLSWPIFSGRTAPQQ